MMNVIRRIAKNTSLLFSSNLLRWVLDFLFVILVTRYLGVTVFGILSFALALTEIFSIFVDLGLNTYTTREVAKEKSAVSKYLNNFLPIKIFLGLGTFLAMIIIVKLLHYPSETVWVVGIMGAAIILTAFRKLFNAIFQAFERMEFIAIGTVLYNACLLLGALMAIFFKLNVTGFAWIYFISSGLTLGYAFYACRKRFVPPELEFDFRFWRSAIKEAWPLGAMLICIMIYFRIDAVMLSFMKGDASVGIYSAAYRLSEICLVIPAVFLSSVFPIMSKYHQGSKEAFIKTYRKSMKYMFILSLPMALLMTLLAKPIVTLIYGNSYVGTAAALQILIWATAIMYVTTVLGNTVISVNKQIVTFKLAIIATLLNITLNLLLIPRYSFMGASLATVLTELFGLCVGIYCLNRWGYPLKGKEIFAPALTGLCMASLVAVFLIKSGFNIIGTSFIVCVVYAIIITRFSIKEDDKQLIRNVFKSSP